MGRAVMLGMGITGRAVAEALIARDHEVVAFDDRISDSLSEWSRQSGIGVTEATEGAVRTALAHADWAVPAPGLPDNHPFFAAAKAEFVPIVSEFDFAQSWDTRPVVGVTGTDGKTTVVTLIERMLEASGIAAAAVGNTDVPWIAAIDDPRPEVFVVEASSFRLAHSQSFSPAVGVWLNLGADHLDAHATIELYTEAKASIWSHLDDRALALANRDDPTVRAHHARVQRGRTASWGLDAGRHGLHGDTLVVDDQKLITRQELQRSLPHDVSNGLAAAAAAVDIGADRDACAQVLRTFDGLPHRLELIADHAGVRWVNDSKATTPHAAAAGLAGYESVILIAGGRNKGLSFDDMTAHSDRVRHVVAIGEAAPLIADAFAGRVSVTSADTMAAAIDIADSVANRGDVVLLSPACASFDWYPNYRARGDDFAALVRARFGTVDTTSDPRFATPHLEEDR